MLTYITSCVACRSATSKQYARKNDGRCKRCVECDNPSDRPTRNERILEHGYQAYAREEGYYE